MATAASPPLPPTTTRAARPRALYSRIALFGLVTAVGAIMAFWASTGFNPEELVFIAPFMAAPAIVAFLVWRFGTWSNVLAAVIGLALFVVNAPFLIPAMTRPQVFFDFTPGAAYLIGSAMAFVGGVAAVVKRRDLRSEPTSGERRIERGALAAIAVLALVSGALALTSRSTATAADREGAMAVSVKDFAYDSEVYTAEAGEEVRFVVHNSDRAWHTFTIEGVVDQGVNPGSDAVIELSGLEAGTYTIYCAPHSEQNASGERTGMVATLQVE